MSRFPTDKHLASWVGLCPGHHESAGKRRSGRARKGNPLRAATRCDGGRLREVRLLGGLVEGGAVADVLRSRACSRFSVT